MSAPITQDALLHTLRSFCLEGDVVSCAPYGGGHINSTQLVTDDAGKRYILQRINTHVFRDVDALMENIQLVTDFLHSDCCTERSTLTLVPTRDGKYYAQNDYGCWRMYHFVEGSVCLQAAESDDDFYESAVAFGRFQQALKNFPVEKLHTTIPNFHNTPDRYRLFREAIERDPMGRVKDVQPEIDFILSHEETVCRPQHMLEEGRLPERVTHNDTKLNNVLLDAESHKALCVIDLDTVMPGLSIFDFGDSIRFGAATAAEDERDLSLVTMSLDRFRAFTRGFVRSCPDLTETELDMLSDGARTITLECGMRFLTDYIDGDCYFATQRPGQNLDRCRTQLKLVADMENKWSDMQRIVKEERL